MFCPFPLLLETPTLPFCCSWGFPIPLGGGNIWGIILDCSGRVLRKSYFMDGNPSNLQKFHYGTHANVNLELERGEERIISSCRECI